MTLSPLGCAYLAAVAVHHWGSPADVRLDSTSSTRKPFASSHCRIYASLGSTAGCVGVPGCVVGNGNAGPARATVVITASRIIVRQSVVAYRRAVTGSYLLKLAISSRAQPHFRRFYHRILPSFRLRAPRARQKGPRAGPLCDQCG